MMKVVVSTLLVSLCSAPLFAAKHESWDAYLKANRFACPGPFDELTAPVPLKLGAADYQLHGFRLERQGDKAKDRKLVLGAISAIKDVSEATKKNFDDAIAWFKEQKVDWVIANGDLALEEFDLEDVFDWFGQTELPILLIPGNSESTGSFIRAHKDRQNKYPNLVNGMWVRELVLGDVEIWTVPGYHDRRFLRYSAGCHYQKPDIDALDTAMDVAASLRAGRTRILVGHGPPKGSGKNAIDMIHDGKNVGDENLSALIASRKISFGIFGHILECGGRAVQADQKTPVRSGSSVESLFISTGSLSADPWQMIDKSTATGMAVLFVLDGGKARYEIKRFGSPPAVSE